MDMVKGIGILFVVMGHSQYLNENIRIVITSFHMPLFFIVSGMLMFHIGEERRPIAASLRRKACSMLVPYAVFSAVYLAIYGGYYCLYLHMLEPKTIAGYLIQTFGLGGMSVLWFLTALFFAELIFLILLKRCQKHHAAVIIICSILAVAAPIVRPYFDRGFPRANTAWKLLYELLGTWLRSMVGMGFLMAGYELMPLFSRLDRHIVSGKRRMLCVCAGIAGLWLTVCLSLANGLTDMHYMIFNRLWIYYLNAFLGTVSLILICKYGKTLRGLGYLGANSLIIMVTHLDCQYMLKAIDVGKFFVSLSPRGKWYCLYFGIIISMLAMELATIYCVNHFVPFVIGRGYPKKKE